MPCHRYFSVTRPELMSVTGADDSYAHGSTITVTAQLTALTNSARPHNAFHAVQEVAKPDNTVCGCAARARQPLSCPGCRGQVLARHDDAACRPGCLAQQRTCRHAMCFENGLLKS